MLRRRRSQSTTTVDDPDKAIERPRQNVVVVLPSAGRVEVTAMIRTGWSILEWISDVRRFRNASAKAESGLAARKSPGGWLVAGPSWVEDSSGTAPRWGTPSMRSTSSDVAMPLSNASAVTTAPIPAARPSAMPIASISFLFG